MLSTNRNEGLDITAVACVDRLIAQTKVPNKVVDSYSDSGESDEAVSTQ